MGFPRRDRSNRPDGPGRDSPSPWRGRRLQAAILKLPYPRPTRDAACLYWPSRRRKPPVPRRPSALPLPFRSTELILCPWPPPERPIPASEKPRRPLNRSLIVCARGLRQIQGLQSVAGDVALYSAPLLPTSEDCKPRRQATARQKARGCPPDAPCHPLASSPRRSLGPEWLRPWLLLLALDEGVQHSIHAALPASPLPAEAWPESFELCPLSVLLTSRFFVSREDFDAVIPSAARNLLLVAASRLLWGRRWPR